MEIRVAGERDFEDIYRLTNELEAEVLPKEKFRNIYLKTLNLENDRILVADEGQILGYIHVKLGEQLHHAGMVAEIQELIVREECRGRHIGSMLLEHAVDFAKECGAVSIELTSNFVRTEAHEFYEKAGFRKTSYKFVYKGPVKTRC